MPQLVAELILHWRNLLRVAIGGADALVEFSPEQRALLAQQAKRSDQTAMMRAITLLCEAENELRWNTQQRLLLELYSLRIMSEEAPVAAQSSTALPARDRGTALPSRASGANDPARESGAALPSRVFGSSDPAREAPCTSAALRQPRR